MNLIGLMRRLSRICWLALVLVPAPVSAQTARIQVEVLGIRGALQQNVLSFLTLNTVARSDEPVSTQRLRRLFGQAPDQIAQALQPFGFYRPAITDVLTTGDRTWVARFTIDPGPQLTVGSIDLSIRGPGDRDSLIRHAADSFPLASGDPLLHAAYAAGKAALLEAAVNQGYLDASFDTAQIQIDRERYRSAIVLHLATGPQYRFGPIEVTQTVLDPAIVQGYVTVTQGDPFDPLALRTMQSKLSATHYFSQVEISAPRDSAQNLEVPVRVRLIPRRPQHFRIGVGYGTNTRFRATVNAEFRRLNHKGHFANVSLQVSGVERSMAARYSIPAAFPKNRLLSFFSGLAFLDPVSYNTTKFVLGSDVSHWRGRWRETLSLAYSLEDYVIGTVDTGVSNLFIASANYTRVIADNKIFATKGAQISVQIRGAVKGLWSNATFLDISVPGRLILPLLGPSRLVSRMEVGRIFTNAFSDLPPTVRYFTGGDRSVRGYQYLSLGPRDAAGNITGGDVLFVGSLEADYFFYKGYGIAAFFDAGNAFDGLSDISLFHGTGLGLRWRSPIGPVGVDLAWAVSLPDTPRTLHITVGPDF